MTPMEILIAAVIGLVAGVVGGLCGIGGSIIMLPALALVFGYDLPDGEPDPTRNAHHLYMAAAAMVNVVVAATSIRPHIRAKAIDRGIVMRLVPPMAIASIAGVVLSNELPGRYPKAALIVFLFLFVAWTLFTAIRKLPEPTPEQLRATTPRVVGIGTLAGFLAGFLAIGGGIVLVPSMQIIARVQLRRAIAASAVAMCAVAPIGAVLRLATLGDHDLAWMDAVSLGLAMAVGAAIGSPLGARLTHVLKLQYLRLVVAIVLGVSGAKMAGFF